MQAIVTFGFRPAAIGAPENVSIPLTRHGLSYRMKVGGENK
jgi:hypothetical protein